MIGNAATGDQLTVGPALLSPLEYTGRLSLRMNENDHRKAHTVVRPEFSPCDYRLLLLFLDETWSSGLNQRGG